MDTKGLFEKIAVIAALCVLGGIIIVRTHKKTPASAPSSAASTALIDSLPADPVPVIAPAQLVFDDPSQYGIITPDEWGSMPSEEQIRATIREQMTYIKETIPPETWEKVQKVIQAPAEEIAESVKKLDERVDLLKKRIDEDPFDSDAKQQLDLLIMLRATAEELSPDVPAPVLPQPPENEDPREVEILIE